METLRIVGMMSGTSLDGMDLALCEFSEDLHQYQIIAAETVAYPAGWRKRLLSLHDASATQLAQADAEYGRYIGRQVDYFLKKSDLTADYVSSHGHTVFHQPEKSFSFQLGSGAAIAAESGIPAICDFRRTDVALGGQGAPLVPIGDRALFSDYAFCLNLGGICNISYETEQGGRVAFDIAPCNLALNKLAAEKGLVYDHDGVLAREGVVSAPLLDELNHLAFYRQPAPKSLGREWFETFMQPVLDHYPDTPENRSATMVRHIALQIANVVERSGAKGKMLLTGGGAYHAFLVETVRELLPQIEVVVPDPILIEFKEAMLFALLGYFRVHDRVNTLASVTGASRDSCSGVVYMP